MANRESDRTDQAIAANLKTLIHGLMQNNTTDLYTSYRELVKVGAPAVPQIRNAITRRDWSLIKYPQEIRFISGLVSVLHDIDEAEALNAVREIKHDGCDTAIARLFNSICRFTLADYLRYEVCGVKVHERKDLATKQAVRPRLERWLKNVPPDDLRDLERLYVVRQVDLDALGSYVPLLFSINLVWNNPCSPVNPWSWLNHYIIEDTLYHEIGHFMHRHTFGQDPDQEKEAQDYADVIMVNSDRTIFRVLRALRKILRLVR